MPKRDDILTRMMQVMGEYPADSRRVAADVEVVEETREAKFVRQKITFGTEVGDRCWAYLFIPLGCLEKNAARRAAMLCLHQTTQIGKGEPAGIGGKPNLHYALELAERGYVALAPDYPNYGDYKVDAYALGYASATMKGIWNHMRAIDLLAGLSYVDAKRIGCIGHSLGGHNTLFLAAFDTRMKVAVSSCGFTLFKCNRRGGQGELSDIADWSHAGYMPRIAERYGSRAENMPFEWSDVLTAIAPRAVFINAPEQDDFLVDGVRECVKLVTPEYAREGATDKLACRHPAGGHDFPPQVRQDAYAVVDQILKA
jgi:hypothetical protein